MIRKEIPALRLARSRNSKLKAYKVRVEIAGFSAWPKKYRNERARAVISAPVDTRERRGQRGRKRELCTAAERASSSRASISYRRINRGFDLDDDALEDVRRELINTLRIAADLDGELLVWAPEGRLARPEGAALLQSLPAMRHPRDRLPRPQSPRRRGPGAERRQLTVMFATW
jgi:hypothetical protein